MDKILIRHANSDDAPAIADLGGTLGYPAGSEVMAERLARILGGDTRVVFVAEIGGAVVGWIEGGEREILADGRIAETLGLVVADSARKKGVGRKLVEAVEDWAATRGLTRLTVRSNVVRPESHAFYERLGYERYKTQHAYRKRL